MRKIISVFVLFCLSLTMLCSLSGCGKKAIDVEQLKEDLNICNEIQDCFTSEYAGSSRYQVSECVITENNLDEEKVQNTIYCTVTAENNNFQVLLDVKAVYHYYDKGWVLDTVSCDLDDVKALTGPDIEKVKSLITSNIRGNSSFSYGVPDEDGTGRKYYYLYSKDNDFSVIDSKVNENGKSASINCCYRSDDAKYYGYYEMLFDKTGWHFGDEDELDHMTLTNFDFDFSNKAIGNFYHSYDDEYASLTVHKIENGMVTYSLQGNDSILINCEFKLGENLTAAFDSTKGEFLEIHYSPEEDMWEFGALELERQY